MPEFAFTHGLGSHCRSDERTFPPRGQPPRGGCVSGERVGRVTAAACGGGRSSREVRESVRCGSPTPFRGGWDRHRSVLSVRTLGEQGIWLIVVEYACRRASEPANAAPRRLASPNGASGLRPSAPDDAAPAQRARGGEFSDVLQQSSRSTTNKPAAEYRAWRCRGARRHEASRC